MSIGKSAAVVSACILVVNVHAAGNIDEVMGKPVHSSGSWEVRVKADPMTDEKTCTAVLKGRPNIQASKDSLYVRIPGGVGGYEFRIDDQPVSDMTLPSDMEKSVSVVIFEGGNHAKIVSAKRLRVQALKPVSGMHFEDIPLDGLEASTAYLQLNCV